MGVLYPKIEYLYGKILIKMDDLGVALFQETSICLEALDVDHILGQLLEAWQTWQSWRSDGPGNSDEHRDLTYNNG